MNCPTCGLQQALADQKFCRSCGASLQMITQPLADAPASDLERTPAIIFKDEKRGTSRLVLWGLIIMFIGAALGITGKMLIHDEIVTFTGGIAFFSRDVSCSLSIPFAFPPPKV